MQVDVRTDGTKAVLALSGRSTAGEDLEPLQEKVRILLHEGYRDFEIDLTSAPCVDDESLGELVAAYAIVQRQRGAVLRLVGLKEQLAHLNVLTKLRSMFEDDLRGPMTDPLDPRPPDFGWKLQLAVALAIFLIISMLIVLR